MKELTQHIDNTVSIGVEKQFPKQKKHLGSLNLHRGLTLWELNLKTKVIAAASFESVNSIIDQRTGKPSVHKKVITKEFCMYAAALNPKNAERKFKIMLAHARAKRQQTAS